MTYVNIGYWIGQANDSSGGQHPTGWTTGQRWSETASEWLSMWSTEWNAARDPQGYAYSYPGQAANAVYWSQTASYWKGQQDAWITNYNNMTADRNYWKTTVAHDDAGVWDNRYNAGYSAGYSAGAASKTTTAVGVGTSGTGGLSGSYSGDLGGVTCPRTGLAHISVRVVSNGDDAALHIFRNGGLAIGGASANGGQNTTFVTHGNLNVNSGDYISVRATGDENSGLGGGYLLVTVGSV